MMQLEDWLDGLDQTASAQALLVLGVARSTHSAAIVHQVQLLLLVQQAIAGMEVSSEGINRAPVRFSGIDFDNCISASQAYQLLSHPLVKQLSNAPVSCVLLDPIATESMPFVQVLSQSFACYWPENETRRPISWHWPLRFGFLRRRQVSIDFERSLKLEMARHPWVGQNSSTQFMDHEHPECDVLVIDESEVSEVLDSQSQLPWSTDVVLVAGGAFEQAHEVGLIREIQRAVRCSAVLWQDFGFTHSRGKPALVGSYIVDLVREISHAWSFDIAAHEAANSFFDRNGRHVVPPLMVATDRFLRNSSIRLRVGNLKKMMSGQADRFVTPAEMPPESRWEVSRSLSLDEIAGRLSNVENDVGFFRESDMATTMSELQGFIADELHRSDLPRYLQSRVSIVDSCGNSKVLRHVFLRGRQHQIDVQIGPPQEGWLSPKSERRFPDERLPTEIDEQEVQVHLIVLHPPYDCDMHTVILPRRGLSSMCTFQVTLPDVKEAWLRLVVTFRNRVMQTALLHGPVRTRDMPPRKGIDPLQLDVETVNVSQLGALHDRSLFDVAVIANYTHDKIPLIGTTSGGRFTFRDAREIVELQQDMEHLIGRIARDRDAYRELSTDASRDLLVTLANYGHDFREHLEDQRSGFSRPGSRIQITSVEIDRRIPIEFCYDGPAPNDNAEVCPHCLRALANGDDTMGCPAGAGSNERVCPLNFWAVNRVIERHLHDQNAADEIKKLGDHYSLDVGDGRPRSGLVLFDRVICGLNRRVEEHVPEGELLIQRSFLDRTPEAPRVVHDWDQWRNWIAESPSLLLIVGHTAKIVNRPRFRRIEIGRESWLDANKLEGYIRRDDKSPQPVVLLFTCEADAQETPLLDFVSHVRREGAAIVVTTNCAINVEHAVELVQSFIPRLHEVCSRTGTMGDVLRRVRRAMLAEGLILPLCLTAFGDADWKLMLTRGEHDPTTDRVDSPEYSPGGAGGEVAPVEQPENVPQVVERALAAAY